MKQLKVAVVRGSALNKWEMQSFEPLRERLEIVACGAEPAFYPTDAIQLPIKILRRRDAWHERNEVLARSLARLGLCKRPADRLIGLEEWLSGFAIAHVAETGHTPSQQAVTAKLGSGVKIAATCWETIPFVRDGDPEVRDRAQTVRAHTDLFLATTARAKNCLIMEGADPNRIRVIMPGVDTARFQPAARPAELIAEYGLEADSFVFLFIGRLIHEKGIRELIIAYHLLLRALPPSSAARCRLLIAGDGTHRAALQDMIDRLCQNQAHIIGTMDYMRIHRLHQMADVFVLPSLTTQYWEEQYGMVLAEAMACGVPVISTRTGGIPEVVGDAGLLVPPMEPEQLMEAMRTLFVDNALRESLGRSGRERAVKELDAEETAAKIERAYADIGLPQSGQPGMLQTGVSARTNI